MNFLARPYIFKHKWEVHFGGVPTSLLPKMPNPLAYGTGSESVSGQVLS